MNDDDDYYQSLSHNLKGKPRMTILIAMVDII